MQRIGIFLMLLVLGGCSVQSADAVNFRNPKTGAVVAACGPLIGFTFAVTPAQEGCTESYQDDGWVVVPGQG